MIALEDILVRLLVALAAGALIGAERQWRQRTAGLRTNALVALGAAGFTLFGLSTPGEASPTRVAAQVASGIGFLGAGVILREGLNIRGLNTAATLWCAAAVGVFAGAGQIIAAAGVAGMVMVINLGVRPVVALIDRQVSAGAGTEDEHLFRITLTCAADREAETRALLLQAVMMARLRLRSLESLDHAGTDGTACKTEIVADLIAPSAASGQIETVVGRLAVEPTVSRAGWTDVSER